MKLTKHSPSPILIKVGGSALQDSELIASLCMNLAQVRASGIPLVLVHGGGPSINEELMRRGISWTFHQGQRITTKEMMEVVEMVLCGKVNRKIVRSLSSLGVQAIGLSGTDANLLVCDLAEEVLGQVGIVRSVNTDLISSFLRTQEKPGKGIIPVIAPVGTDGRGTSLNINADWAAARIAQALEIKKMIYLTDQDGVLSPSGELIPRLDPEEIEDLIARKVITGGMLTKTRTILAALRNQVTEIHILNGKKPSTLMDVLLSKAELGTSCVFASVFTSKEEKGAYA